MNILFLTMNTFTGLEMHNIYSDLMKEFVENGHRPYIVAPRERRLNEKTELVDYDTYSLLKVRIGNTSNVSLIEKGISTVTLNCLFRRAIKKQLGDIRFGLILYSTPPITIARTISNLKKHCHCKTYLMLKDIFPQNAVDLGMMRMGGLIQRYFRSQEKALYRYSDKIGCMSPANVDYLLNSNHDLDPSKVEVCPNAITPKQKPDKQHAREKVVGRYGIPDDAVIYMYGGNLGKPQGIPFLIDVLEKIKNDAKSFFIICGSGSEYDMLESFIKKENPGNVVLQAELPKEDYDTLLSGCDVGLLFLDHRFTIPNYPSRMLSYMEQSMPIAAFTDTISDIRETILEGGFGWWGPSNDVKTAVNLIRSISSDKDTVLEFGNKARTYLEQQFTTNIAYATIMKSIE